MFEPPSNTNWVSVGPFFQGYADEYKRGYDAAATGKKVTDNPNEQSGHERDTTFKDELYYWWYVGFTDYETT